MPLMITEIGIHMQNEYLGNDYGGFNTVLDGLNKDSVVYSFGIGQDISWDIAMHNRTGCLVHGFDPTPESITWVKQEREKDAPDVLGWFLFYDCGISSCDGRRQMYHHVNPDYVTCSVQPGGNWKNSPHAIADFYSLETIMKKFGHSRIDVLKLCLGGDHEYYVLIDVLYSGIRPGQITYLDLHHTSDQKHKTSKMMGDCGYSIVNTKKTERPLWVRRPDEVC